MIIFKLLGCILVLLSTTGIGLYFSGELKDRINDLLALKKIIVLLRGDIQFTHTPLPEAIQTLSIRHEGKFKDFLTYIANELNELSGVSFSSVWDTAITTKLTNTSLDKKDLAHLSQFGENLGYLDKDMQINTIDLYLAQVEETIKELSQTAKEKASMYNSLGVLTGLFICIIIF